MTSLSAMIIECVSTIDRLLSWRVQTVQYLYLYRNPTPTCWTALAYVQLACFMYSVYSINQQDSDGSTLLHLLVKANKTEYVKILRNKDLNASKSCSYTWICGQSSCCDLFSAGYKLVDSRGRYPLHYLSRHRENEDLVHLLSDRYNNYKVQTWSVHYACLQIHYQSQGLQGLQCTTLCSQRTGFQVEPRTSQSASTWTPWVWQHKIHPSHYLSDPFVTSLKFL